MLFFVHTYEQMLIIIIGSLYFNLLIDIFFYFYNFARQLVIRSV